MKRDRIGPKIRNIRKSRNLSQKDLADVLGYSDKSMITHIEKGDSDMQGNRICLQPLISCATFGIIIRIPLRKKQG